MSIIMFTPVLQTMKSRYKSSALLVALGLAILLSIMLGYYLISPKIVLNNLSPTEYDEFIIQLPSSRISFSPVEVNSSSTIFYSRQNEAGIGYYSLGINGQVIADGTFTYNEGSELGRVVKFTLDSDGQVLISD